VGLDEKSSNPKSSRRFSKTTAAKHTIDNSVHISLFELCLVELFLLYEPVSEVVFLESFPHDLYHTVLLKYFELCLYFNAFRGVLGFGGVCFVDRVPSNCLCLVLNSQL